MNAKRAALQIKYLLDSRKFCDSIGKRFISSLPDEIKRQNHIFNVEAKRQRESVGRIDKIEVKYIGNPENVVVMMNKNISTPNDVAKHLSEKLAKETAVAQLNNGILWHMHKPLPDNCELSFFTYNMPQPYHVNKVFWRSCSFLLGAVAQESFKDNVVVNLHSFPSPNVRSGSFIYDIQLSLDDWKPTQDELKVLSLEMIKFCQQNHEISSLDVDMDIAQDIFKNNSHKFNQIPDIAGHNNGRVTLFRAAHHIDISRGPMVPNTNHLGRITVSNVIKLNTDIAGDPIYRFQGVALPKTIILNHFAFSLLEERARELNPARIPCSQEHMDENNTFEAQIVQ